MRSTEKALFAFAVGITVGSVLGVLFAPDKGAGTRKKIGNKLNEGKDKVESMVEQFSEIVEQGKQSLKEAIAEGKRSLDDMAEEMEMEDNG